MSEPCTQNQNLSRIESKVDSIANVVAQIAVQRNDIEHIGKSVDGLREWMIKHESRIQTLEKAPGATATRAWVVLYTSAIGAAFSTAVYLITAGVPHG